MFCTPTGAQHQPALPSGALSLSLILRKLYPEQGFILIFIALLYFARPDKPMLDMESARHVMRHTGGNSRGDGKALPYPVAIALVHYASSNITPQQTREEMMVTANILSRRGPCNFLIYGLGFDSPLWQALNHGGRTVFLEEDPSWIAQMLKAHPSLETYAVNYTTTLTDADDLLAYVQRHQDICFPSERNLRQSKCKLVLKSLPEHLYGVKWDVIMIDAPRGYSPEFPGRMTAIYTSALMARAASHDQSTDILVHDVDRPVESKFSMEFFCAKNRMGEIGKLWHFQIFGEGAIHSSDFCTSSYKKRA
ncbi:hypothetical protein GOP47_0023552 [Adiantum capillus-veneris]|uniref:Polysaccharide biosynthesis domain-containing protein n=1 Tax=Adiantum capillus-veneris TaxID=13818 RepID=A0A9D4U4R3_ADICA|nr:hypothetical protein GOP47_0023552 [Adiantum capillus-veneris]